MNDIYISRKELHLAAFVKASGATLLDFDKTTGSFIFESDTTTEKQFRINHTNSCCRKTDVELFQLKKFLTC